MLNRKNRKIASPVKEWLLVMVTTGGFLMLFVILVSLLGFFIMPASDLSESQPVKQKLLFAIPAVVLLWLFLSSYFKLQRSKKAFIENVSKTKSKLNINLMQKLAKAHAPSVDLKVSLWADCCYFVGTIFMHHDILKFSEKVITFITMHEIAHHLQYKTVEFSCKELHYSKCIKEDKAFLELLDLFGEDALLEVDADYYAVTQSGLSVEDMRSALTEVSKIQGMELTGLTKEYLDLRIKCVESLLIEALATKSA